MFAFEKSPLEKSVFSQGSVTAVVAGIGPGSADAVLGVCGPTNQRAAALVRERLFAVPPDRAGDVRVQPELLSRHHSSAVQNVSLRYFSAPS